jgi:hypothetical protein
MDSCEGCGFRNAPGRDTCAKCGRVFRASAGGAGLKLALVVGLVLVCLGVGLGAIFLIFSPEGKPPPPRIADAEPVRPPERIPDAAPPPAPAESASRRRGGEFLRKADRLYADGDYPAAAAAYEEARFAFGALEAEAAARKEVADWVVQVKDIRDYLAKESYLEPPRVTLGHLQLSKMDPARLPTDAWREEHRKTLARLEKAVVDLDLRK